jgi:hypothetical protein
VAKETIASASAGAEAGVSIKVVEPAPAGRGDEPPVFRDILKAPETDFEPLPAQPAPLP